MFYNAVLSCILATLSDKSDDSLLFLSTDHQI